jgi:hypothetical protein
MAGAPPWVDKKKDSSSDTQVPGGLRFKADPTLPPGQKAIVDSVGKRAGVVKKIGDKWSGSWDNYKQKFDSPQAALKQLGMTKKMGKDAPDKKA